MVPYSPDAYLGLLAQYNATIWPAQIVALLAILLILLAVFRRWPNADRIASAVLAASWLWTGAVWQGQYYATLNWGGVAFGACFVLQALLLLWTGVWRDRLTLVFLGRPKDWVAVLLLLVALAIHPLVSWFATAAPTALQVIGIAPTPTTIFTFGLLLLATPRIPIHLIAVPTLWSLIDGATAWSLGLWSEMLLPLGGIAVAATILGTRAGRE